MILRTAAALMFTSAGALIGVKRSLMLRERAELCRVIGDLLRNCSALIRCQALNVYELTADLRRSGRFEHLTFLDCLPESYVCGDDFHSIWHQAVLEQLSIGEDERDLLVQFGDILGTTDTDGQVEAIQVLTERQKQLEERRTEEYRRKGRLERCIWTLFGVMTAIIVI